MYETLLTERKGGIELITVNRPDKMNALNRQVMEELSEAIAAVVRDPRVGAAVITGAGPKAFVAGADISEFSGLSKRQGREMAAKGQDIFFSIERSPKPIVAAVNGFALGGGCELAMACHFRVASENAKFGQPEVNLGLIPGYGGTQRLTQLVGKGRAIELLISGSMIDARRAYEIGLVNTVTTPDQLLDVTLVILQDILTKAPIAVAHCLKAAQAAFEGGAAGYLAELDGFEACFGTEDVKEGTRAFLEKRKAQFKGR